MLAYRSVCGAVIRISIMLGYLWLKQDTCLSVFHDVGCGKGPFNVKELRYALQMAETHKCSWLQCLLQDKQVLLMGNVFAVSHKAGGGARIVFENRPVEVYAAERLSEIASVV